ncbi:MAG: hypothetical protein WCW36_01020 [Candidatus Paceibacterota bacterium]|jgi:hypothetical protein
MTDIELMSKVRSLPAKQQIALWLILKEFHKPKGTWFTALEFAIKMKKYLLSEDPAELARIIGGIISSLKRNGMIEQFTGGRKPVWQVTPELHKNAKKYQDAVFPVVTYWGS